MLMSKSSGSQSALTLPPIYELIAGDCLKKMTDIPEKSVSLVFSSPPYNIGKAYEKRQSLEKYFDWQSEIIALLASRLSPSGSICWQTGNFVNETEVVPLDVQFDVIFQKVGLKLQRRFVWRFGHGLHCMHRFSGRYETISWYTFPNFDFQVHYPIQSEWISGAIDVPNVKSNHVEKTSHPCQFPVELAERFVLAFTEKGQSVLDPFAGVGSTVVAAVKNERIGLGIELDDSYVAIGRTRLLKLEQGVLETRKLGTPIYVPSDSDSIARLPASFLHVSNPSLVAEQAVQGAHFKTKCVTMEPNDFFAEFASNSAPLFVIHSCFVNRVLLAHLYDKLPPNGSICIYVDHDTQGFQMTTNELLSNRNLRLRNRIVMWNTQRKQFSSVFWLTKGEYHFDLDSVRVPAKYPGKKSHRTGCFSGNPLGKNPSDVWTYCDDGCTQLCGVTACEFKRIVRALCPVNMTTLIFMPTFNQATAGLFTNVSELKRHVVIGAPPDTYQRYIATAEYAGSEADENPVNHEITENHADDDDTVNNHPKVPKTIKLAQQTI